MLVIQPSIQLAERPKTHTSLGHQEIGFRGIELVQLCSSTREFHHRYTASLQVLLLHYPLNATRVPESKRTAVAFKPA